MITKHIQNALLSIFLVITPSTLPMTYTNPEDPQEESALCQLPQNVLFLIAEHLTTMEKTDAGPHKMSRGKNLWKTVNTLASTCQLLDRRVNVLGLKISINAIYSRERKTESVASFLSQVIHVTNRMVHREGYNPIYICLPLNSLADDMAAFQKFLETCAQQPIVAQLKGLDLWANELEEMPEAITQLHNLESLILEGNRLGDKIITQVSALHSLKILHLGFNRIQKLDPAFVKLKNLQILVLSQNALQSDALAVLSQFENLEELTISRNFISEEEIIKSFKKLPRRLVCQADV
jgi:hypothetical protein